MDLPQLIDQAAAKVGSHTELAKRLKVTPQRLSEWKHNRRPCPLETQGLIAEAAGEDPGAWQCRQTLRQVGRIAAAVLLSVAATLAAWHAPVAGGHGRPGRR